MSELAFVFSLGVLTGIGLSLIAAALYVRSWWRSMPAAEPEDVTPADISPTPSTPARKAA